MQHYIHPTEQLSSVEPSSVKESPVPPWHNHYFTLGFLLLVMMLHYCQFCFLITLFIPVYTCLYLFIPVYTCLYISPGSCQVSEVSRNLHLHHRGIIMQT